MESNISFEKTEANFTIIANHILRDNRVSLKARGLYATIQGFPDSWNMSIKGLESILKDGKDSIRASLKELIEFGYIEYSKFQNEKGYWMHKYKLLISPKTENPKVENPTSENPTSGNPTSGNPPQLINNKSNTQVIKKQVLNIIPDFSENCTDLSANADSKNNFPNSNFSLNQPVSPPIEEAISKESEKKKPSRSASKGKNPFEIEYTEGFIKFWKAFTPHGSKGQSFDYWKEFKLEAQTERVLKALELYHLELQAQPWREKIHGERFLKNLLAGYIDKLEDPSSLISSAEKDNQIQARRDEIRPKWMYEMADRQKNKEKTIEFNDWLAQNNMPELIKVYTYTD